MRAPRFYRPRGARSAAISLVISWRDRVRRERKHLLLNEAGRRKRAREKGGAVKATGSHGCATISSGNESETCWESYRSGEL